MKKVKIIGCIVAVLLILYFCFPALLDLLISLFGNFLAIVAHLLENMDSL